MKRIYMSIISSVWFMVAGFSCSAYGSEPNPAHPNVAVPAPQIKSIYGSYIPGVTEPLADWKAQAAPDADRNQAVHRHHMTTDSAGKAKPLPRSNAEPVMSHDRPGAIKEDRANSAIRGIGVVQQIDKANNKIKIAHDPIQALGWPKMVMFMRVKAPSLTQQINEGDKVDFVLEKSTSGYVIAEMHKAQDESSPPANH